MLSHQVSHNSMAWQGSADTDGLIPTTWTALPHLLTKNTSEESCEQLLLGLSSHDCVICISCSLFYPLMNSHQRYVPFIIIYSLIFVFPSSLGSQQEFSIIQSVFMLHYHVCLLVQTTEHQ